MKSKKLLVSLSIVAVVIVLIVVLAAVFAVQDATVVYHAFDGSQTVAPNGGGISRDDVMSFAKGKSIVFLSKSDLMTELNKEHSKWHAFAVVKNFPNTLEVHVVERVAIAKIDILGKTVYVDSFGYIAEATDGNCIDITSAFNISTDNDTYDVGSELKFKVEQNNVRLKCVIEAILATWQCNYEINDLFAVLSENNIFTFDSDGSSMSIKMRSGGTIKVMSPETNLTSRLIKAYGVYFNEYIDLQSDDVVITVSKNGQITTPSKNS